MRYQVTFSNGAFPRHTDTEQSAKLIATKVMALSDADVTAVVWVADKAGTYRSRWHKHSGGEWHQI